MADELQVVRTGADPKQQGAAGGAALEAGNGGVAATGPGDDPREPTPTPPSGEMELAHAARSASGKVYTWQDGEDTRRVVLQAGLTVRSDGSITEDELVVPRSGTAVVEGGGGGPVFRAEGDGGLMTLPGGVLLVLDPAWEEVAVAAFLERNAIAERRVSELGWLPNGFFVETRPGFPSLDLANALAGQEGVVLAAPNWWREVEPR